MTKDLNAPKIENISSQGDGQCMGGVETIYMGQGQDPNGAREHAGSASR